MFDTDPYDKKMSGAVAHFEEELKKVRTGRSHPSMLDGVMVELYGTKMPLNQAANITAPEPQLLQVTPFDPSNVAIISAAIRSDQNLGFNPSDDGRIIRVPVPALTEERRKQMVKQTGEKVEDAKIALRSIRQDAFKDAKRRKEAKELGDDDVKRVEKEIDKAMAGFQDQVEQLFKVKEKDILII